MGQKMKIVNFLLVLVLISDHAIAQGSTQSAATQVPAKNNKDTKKQGAKTTTTSATPKKVTINDPNFKPVKCHKDLIESQGLKGNNFSKNESMDMCGSMKNGSCCDIEDQIHMFNYWNGEVGSSELKNKFKEYQDIYERHLRTVSKLMLTASKLNSKIRVLNNCKMITQTIKKFNFTQAMPKLKENSQRVFTLWENSYKGFYCTICNGENQKFFDLNRQTIQISADYCWNVASKNVPFLLYFHNHLSFLTNLLTNFVTWCDKEGNFEYQQISTHLTVAADLDVREELMACKSNLNSPDWLTSCMPICQRVSLVNFPEFFKPHMRTFERLHIYLQKMEKKFEDPQPVANNKDKSKDIKKTDTGVNKSQPAQVQGSQQTQPATPSTQSSNPTNPPAQQQTQGQQPVTPSTQPRTNSRKLRGGRKLAERNHSHHQKSSVKVTKNSNKHGIDRFLSLNEDEPPVEKQKFNVANIYYEADAEPIIVSGLDKKVSLDTFSIIVGEEGIDLYKTGQATKFTPDALTSVKALIKLGIKSGKGTEIIRGVVLVLLMAIGLFN